MKFESPSIYKYKNIFIKKIIIKIVKITRSDPHPHGKHVRSFWFFRCKKIGFITFSLSPIERIIKRPTRSSLIWATFFWIEVVDIPAVSLQPIGKLDLGHLLS
jgi:hypothetical protein